MAILGDMSMPEGFRYRSVSLKGKPQHDKTDSFRLRHPSMDVGRRAKIFAPFDALRGFSAAVLEEEALSGTQQDDLQRLAVDSEEQEQTDIAD